LQNPRPFLFLFIAQKVHILSFLYRMHLLGRKLRNAADPRILSASNLLLPSFF
jgi:hypothetical protein